MVLCLILTTKRLWIMQAGSKNDDTLDVRKPA